MLKNISDYLLQGNNMAYMTVAFTFLMIIGYSGYSLVNYQVRKKRRLPTNNLKFTTRNIAYISMMIAVSVSVTVVISITLPVTVFPPIRVAFTGIMIKITGLIFGPIVGIIVGATTEMLCLMFVPSYIHVAYFFVSIGFGFWAGLTSFATRKTNKNSKWFTLAIINAYIVIFAIVMVMIVSNSSIESSFFGIEVSAAMLPYAFIIMMSIILIIVWTFFGVMTITKKTRWLEMALPIILMCVVTETLSTILIASWGDSGFLGIPSKASGYISLVAVRLLMSPIKIIFNTTILTTVYLVLNPLIKRA